MIYRKIGNTELDVSLIGLGTTKFGRNQGVKYPQAFDLPDEKQLADLLAIAKELGINLIDTAPAYGLSEQRLGKLLTGNRQDWILSTKVGEEFLDGNSFFDFSPKHIERSIQRSLNYLKTDYLDIVLVHSNGDDCRLIEELEVFSVLEKAKQQGLIRAYGMSSKTVEGGLKTLELADIAMITYNPTYTDEAPVIEYAQENNKGIFIKKALASGHLDKINAKNPIQTAFEFLGQQTGISSIILGTINPTHLRQNVDCLLTAMT